MAKTNKADEGRECKLHADELSQDVLTAICYASEYITKFERKKMGFSESINNFVRGISIACVCGGKCVSLCVFE